MTSPRHNWLYSPYIEFLSKNGSIKHDDLWTLSEEVSANYQYNIFKARWEKELKKSKPNLLLCLIITFWRPLLYATIMEGVNVVFQFAIPVIIPFMLQYLSDPNEPYFLGYIYSVIVFVCMCISSISWYKGMWLATVVSLKVRTVLMLTLYDKSTKATTVIRGSYLNQFSQDAALIFFYMPWIAPSFTTPFTVIIAVILLYLRVGWIAFITAAILILVTPIVISIGHSIGKLRLEMQARSDDRLKYTTELIQGIRIVKYYGWEPALLPRIKRARERELQSMTKIGLWRSVIIIVPFLTPTICAAITFILYGINGGILTATTAFTTLSLMNILRVPLQFFSSAGLLFFGIQSSIKRMNKTLLGDEIVEYVKDWKSMNFFRALFFGEFCSKNINFLYNTGAELIL